MAGKSKYTDEEILNNVKLVGQDFKYAPTQKEFINHPLHILSPIAIVHRLGPWITVCEKAGLKLSTSQLTRGKKYIDNYEERIREACLEEIAPIIIMYPTKSISMITRKYMERCTHICRIFGSTEQLAAALYKKYGLKIVVKQRTKIQWTKELLKQEFLRIQNLLKKRPTLKELVKYSAYVNIYYGIRKIYGTYASLCIDLGCNFRARKRTPDVIQQKKLYYIKKLRQIDKQAKKERLELTGYQYKELCGAPDRTVIELFGSVENWFKEAKVKEPKSLKQFRYKTDEEIFKFIRKLAKKLGKNPSAKEYDSCPDKPICRTHAARRYGSWNNCKKLAGLK